MITSDEGHRLDLIDKIRKIRISSAGDIRASMTYQQAEAIYNHLTYKMNLIHQNLISRGMEDTKENIATLNALTNAQILAGTVRKPSIETIH